MSDTRQLAMKSPALLRAHIADLLMIRKEDQQALARYCGHERSWINKVINGHRELQIQDLDRIADFFGIATYQLFQPGISPISERRERKDRRQGQERRIGHQQRELHNVAEDMNLHRPRAHTALTQRRSK